MTRSIDDWATGCTVGESWFNFRQGYDINIFSEYQDPVMGTGQTPVYWVLVILPGVKLVGLPADATCPHSAEIKNGWSYTSISA
jgi:hypothetical protein